MEQNNKCVMTEAMQNKEVAYEGKGEQKAGDWCKFCRAKPVCRACADEALALAKEEFLDLDEAPLSDPDEPEAPIDDTTVVFKQPGLIPLSELEEISFTVGSSAESAANT